MKSRLHRIEIQNFKAFREFSLNLEGRHLFVYRGSFKRNADCILDVSPVQGADDVITEKGTVHSYFDNDTGQRFPHPLDTVEHGSRPQCPRRSGRVPITEPSKFSARRRSSSTGMRSGIT